VLAFRWAAAYVLLANVPIWVGQHFFPTPPRAIFNVDYIVAAVIGLYVPSVVYYSLFAAVFLIDLVANATSIFYFSQRDFAAAAKYLTELPWKRTLLLATSLLICGLVLGALCRKVGGFVRPVRRKTVAIFFCGVSIVLLILGAVTGSNPFRDRDLSPGPKIGSSMTRRTAVNFWSSVTNNVAPTPFTPTGSATGQLLSELRNNSAPVSALDPRRNIVLVLVESYGLMSDSASAARLASPYQSPAVLAKYTVESGTVPFKGPTVSGEFRELCGLQADISSSKVVHSIAEECLPHLMKQRGYETTAVHGFLGRLFDRDIWYRDLGFDHVHFKEDLRHVPGLSECGGGVPGICDADVARFLETLPDSETGKKPQFYYWLTLTSHLPVEVAPQDAALQECGSPVAANSDAAICSWMVLIYKVNQAIAKLSTNRKLPSTEFIIVGDHAPPFAASTRRREFSQQVVPFIHLLPKP
jgi:hypothetical protein